MKRHIESLMHEDSYTEPHTCAHTHAVAGAWHESLTAGRRVGLLACCFPSFRILGCRCVRSLGRLWVCMMSCLPFSYFLFVYVDDDNGDVVIIRIFLIFLIIKLHK